MKDIDIKLLELLKEGSATVEDMQKATIRALNLF